MDGAGPSLETDGFRGRFPTGMGSSSLNLVSLAQCGAIKHRGNAPCQVTEVQVGAIVCVWRCKSTLENRIAAMLLQWTKAKDRLMSCPKVWQEAGWRVPFLGVASRRR